MKTLMRSLWLFLMLFPSLVGAQTFSNYFQNAVKTAEVDSAFNLKGDKFAAAYVPLRTLNVPYPNVLDVGAGAVFGAGKPEGLVSVRINIPQVINGIFGTSWLTSISSGTPLPTVFIGPAIKAAWPINTWTWKSDTFLLIGLPFSSLP